MYDDESISLIFLFFFCRSLIFQVQRKICPVNLLCETLKIETGMSCEKQKEICVHPKPKVCAESQKNKWRINKKCLIVEQENHDKRCVSILYCKRKCSPLFLVRLFGFLWLLEEQRKNAHTQWESGEKKNERRN